MLLTAGRWPWKSESAKECVTTHLPKQPALKMDGALAFGLYSAVETELAHTGPVRSQRVGGCRGVRGRVSTQVYLEPPLAQILVVVANT